MMARTLRIGMALEVILFGLVGRWLLGMGWTATLALILGGMAAVRLLTIGVTWWMAWRHASPAPRRTLGQHVAMVLQEWWAYVQGFAIVQPFPGWWMPADRLPASNQPVLLVHGYGCNRACWWWMRRRLEADGRVVATLSMEAPWGSIVDFAEQLHARIEAVRTATGAAQVALVAHSMGGLVCRQYLAQHGAQAVARLITIGTPHHGTELSRLGLGVCARQMQPGSTLLAALAAHRVGVPFVSIRMQQDNFVMPQDTQRHPDAVDEPLPGIGHLTSLSHPKVLALLRQHLAAAAV